MSLMFDLFASWVYGSRDMMLGTDQSGNRELRAAAAKVWEYLPTEHRRVTYLRMNLI